MPRFLSGVMANIGYDLNYPACLRSHGFSMTRAFLGLGSILLFVLPALGQEKTAETAAIKFFETNVRPVLANRCYECHGPEMQKGKLRVDSLAALLQGGRSGPAILAGKPDESLMIQAIRHGETLKMPQKNKL